MMPVVTSQETEAYAKSMRIQEEKRAEQGPGGLQEFEAQRERYHLRSVEYNGPIDMVATWMDAHSMAKMLNMNLVHEHRSGFNGTYTFLKKD